MECWFWRAAALALLLCVNVKTGIAASFDCRKASTTVEKMICANDTLSRLDDQMAESYQRQLATTNSNPALVAEQTAWRRDQRDRCRDEGCLIAEYTKRVQVLAQHRPGRLTDGDLLKRFESLNGKCRGGSGDDPATKAACDSRDATFSNLQARGWCWGKPTDQYESEKSWYFCGGSATEAPGSKCIAAVDPYVRAVAIAFAGRICSLRSEVYLVTFKRALSMASNAAGCTGTKDEEAQRDRIFGNELSRNGLDLNDLASTCRTLRATPALLNDLDAQYGRITNNYR